MQAGAPARPALSWWAARKPASGSGLAGLADRVAAISGSLSVDSSPGHGTTITAEILVTT
jgi:signal transduction histidine kinase